MRSSSVTVSTRSAAKARPCEAETFYGALMPRLGYQLVHDLGNLGRWFGEERFSPSTVGGEFLDQARWSAVRQ